MKRKLISPLLLALALLLSSLSGCVPAQEQSDIGQGESSMTDIDVDFIIAADGVVLTPVVIGKNASAKEQDAAKDLQSTIQSITGGVVEIIQEDKLENYDRQLILVGNTELTVSLGYEKPEGYPGSQRTLVKQHGNYLIVLGNDSGHYTGTQHAATMLLEEIGCGWFGTEELWQVIPDKKDIDVTGINLDITPKYSSRISRVSQTYPEFGIRWYEGGDISLTGHWLPQVAPASLYGTNPEWFALNGGSRDPSRFFYWQYCYSNDELIAFIAQQVITKFTDDPNLVSLTLASNDGWDEGWCYCDKCNSLGNASDQMVYFVNGVAKLVKDEFPDRRLHILSYHNTFLPPENTVALEENVELILCRESPMNIALDTDFKYQPVKDSITRVYYTQTWLENAKEYIAKTSPATVAVWDWYCLSASSEGWKTIPWVQGEVAARNQAVYDSLGVEYVFYDHGPTAGYFEDESSFSLRWPLWYVAKKLSWDSSLTAEQILRDACDKLYGAASELMYTYYASLAKYSEECTGYSNTWVPPSVHQMYSGKNSEITEIFDQINALRDRLTEAELERISVQKGYWSNVLRFTK